MPTALPVVLVPGVAEDARIWEDVVPLLTGPVVADPRAGGGPVSVEAYADAVLATAPPRAVLAGHSLGGLVALAAALRAPHRVAGLVLVACGLPMAVHPRLLELLATDAAAALARIASAATGGRGEAPGPGQEALAARLTAVMGDADPTRMAAELRAVDAFDPRPWPAGLAVPAACLAGAHDKMVPAAASAALADALGVTAVVLPGAGHQLPWERPEAVAAACAALA